MLAACFHAAFLHGAQAPAEWITTWATGMAEPTVGADGSEELVLSDHTLRNIVHVSAGGEQARIRVSNVFGKEPLLIGAAHLALRSSGSAINATSDRAVTFSGQADVSVPPGAYVLSDAVSVHIPPQSDLAVSIFLPRDRDRAVSKHSSAFQTSYLAAGNVCGAVELQPTKTVTSWFYLSGIEVSGDDAAGTIVALGDSITDGSVTKIDTNHRWTDIFASRLLAAKKNFGVANEGIGGNRILHDGRGPMGPRFGRSTLARFDRDVLSQPGLRYLVVLEGINDIGHPGSYNLPEEAVSAQDIIAGLRQVIVRAHVHGVKVFGATMTPFAITKIPNYYSPEGEKKRQAVNQWIRTSGEFDGVIDFEKAVRNPDKPDQMLPNYDSGDHLHPNDEGQKAMADAVDLSFFQ